MDSIGKGNNASSQYEVLGQLGSGGMGEIHLAKESGGGRLVALKKISHFLVGTPGGKERFSNELRAQLRIDHPNVVKAYGMTELDGHDAIVLEYIKGESLASLIEQGPLSLVDALPILLQIAYGLRAIHAAGIVHRDLSPDNVLLGQHGAVKISDFGVAGLGGDTTLTNPGSLVGAAKYVAPEFIETGECDCRGDIYAWGVVAFELMVGRSPFKASKLNELVMERFNFNVREELLAAHPTLSPPMVAIIVNAMNVSVAQRYQSTTELISDLEILDDVTFSRTGPNRVIIDTSEVETVLKKDKKYASCITFYNSMIFLAVVITGALYALVVVG